MTLGCSYFPLHRAQVKVGPLEQPGTITEWMP